MDIATTTLPTESTTNLPCHAWLGTFAQQVLNHLQVSILWADEQWRCTVNHLTVYVGAVRHQLLNDLDVITLTRYEQRSTSILVHTSPANTQNVRHQLLNDLGVITLTRYEQRSTSILVHASPANTQNVRHQLLNDLDVITLTCYSSTTSTWLHWHATNSGVPPSWYTHHPPTHRMLDTSSSTSSTGLDWHATNSGVPPSWYTHHPPTHRMPCGPARLGRYYTRCGI